MNLYYKEFTKAKLLKKVIDRVFNIDLKSKGRQRHLVNARMIFSKILRDEKYSYKQIAFFLNLESHASIMYYMKEVNFILTYEKDLKVLYDKCIELYKDADPNVEDLAPNELRTRIDVLEDRNKLLSLEVEALKNLIKDFNKEDKRFLRLFNLIRSRTKKGSEDEVARKLNTIYNGIANG
jgi:hypothetical protein